MIKFSNFFIKKISSTSQYCTNRAFEKSITVPTFCKLLVNVPYNVNLKPTDVYEYPNCDKLVIKMINKNCFPQSFQYHRNNDEIIIEDSSNENLICDIQAPIKADLSVKTKNGNVNIIDFNGGNIVISTENGDVFLNKHYGEKLEISCRYGNVNFAGIIQATDINVRILENGSISTEKLQGLRTKLITKLGNINVNSSYCNESEFSTENGNLFLKNIHKICRVSNTNGNIKMVGMDGRLDLFQGSGDADVQLSRIEEFSKIRILNGKLCLGISSECRENVKIRSTTLKIHENLKMFQKRYRNDTLLEFLPGTSEKLLVDCENGQVFVKIASWTDNFSNVYKLEGK